MAQLNDIEKILSGCKKGKRKYQEALFKMYADKMFGVCRYYTRDYTEAEDVLHEGFIKVFGHIGKFRNEGSLEGWIRRIIVNTALEKFRKQHRMFPISEEHEEIEDDKNLAVESLISADELMEIIKELSPKYRMVFNLYAIEGYSHKEISGKLGISEGTSKSNLARARTILQSKVKERYGNQTEQKLRS